MGANDTGVIGQSIKRKEDVRFLTGAGQFTDDVNQPNQVHAVFLRSPHAHARIRKVDTAKAKAAPGVVAIYTGADLEGVNGLPCGWLITSVDGTPMKEPPHHVLAKGKVRHVGDQVALVVAETLDQAKDAAELIDIDYEVLPAVVNVVDALKPGAPQIHLYAEETAMVWASKRVGRPIKWVAERSESFLSDAHGRDHVTRAELALDQDGKFLALRVHTIAAMGAYLSTFASCIPTILYATLLAGQYTTPAIFCEVTAAFTNTAPVDAYRGAGRPEATYVVERIVHQAAVETGVPQDELRRRNFIREFPYQTPVALNYDVGNYDATLDAAMAMADVTGFAARKADAQKRGKLRGLGYASYIEACGLAPSNIAGALGARAGLFEAGEVRVHPTGSVTVFTGSHSHGQGHETTFAQVVASRLGVPVDNVDVVHGDTGRVPFGMGTYGSRSLAVGGTAIVKAVDKVIAKGKKIAAHLLEAAEADIEFKDGKFTVAGTDRSKTFGEIALTAYVPHNYPHDSLEPGLYETAFYDPTNFTFPAGTHICEVEVDPDTGVVGIVNFSACDDFGNIVNPMIVEGQVHGGLTQGIGQALLENCVYDKDTGQLLTGSYMDYAMPRADDVPSFNVGTKVTPCTHNPLGAKGCGEAGAIGAPAALMNAVHDALLGAGVKYLDMPASPHRVWSALQSAKR